MKDIASYALDALVKAGADKASCRAAKSRKDEFNVEAGKFTLLRTLFTDDLQLKAIVGGRKGIMVVNKLDRASVDEAVRGCIALAKSAEPDEAEDIAPGPESQDFDLTIGGIDKAALFSRTKEYIEQVRDEFPKIKLGEMSSEFNGGEVVYVNSNGVQFTKKSEHYGYSNIFSGSDGEKSSSMNYCGAALKDLSVPFMSLALQRRMLEESVKSLDTRMVEGKFTGKVIVTPTCPDIIWYTLMSCFLTDRPMIEGTSRWKDALNTAVASPALTLRIVPLNPAIAAGERVTTDGFASKDADIIKAGVLKSFALTLYGANKTGNARAANTANYNIEVAAGDTALDEIIKGVDKGILLNRFSGGMPGPSGDISGVAKNSFLIENGKITDALQETMLSFNVLDALKNITAISKERVTDGTSILPWCCFDGITISGK